MSAPRSSQTPSSGRGGASIRSRKRASWSRGRIGAAAGVGPVGQRLQAAPVVGGDPRLDGAAADAQGAGDLRCGVALLGQDDGLHAGPGAGVAVSPGRLLQAVQRVMILDVHLRDVPIDPCP